MNTERASNKYKVFNKNELYYVTMPFRRKDIFDSILNNFSSNYKKLHKNHNALKVEEDMNFSKINKATRILLVEDSAINTNLMQQAFKSKGLSCDTVHNGVQAVNACNNNDYDIVFMDCQMPVMDGYEATRRIKKIKEKIIIIAMTANALKGDKERCLAAGMNDYVSKPININNVMALIEKYSPIPSKLIIETAVKDLSTEMEIKIEQAYELINSYIEALPGSMFQLSDYIEQDDYIEAKKLAHKMKGTALNLRMHQLAEQLVYFENLLVKPDKRSLLLTIYNISSYTDALKNNIN